MACPAGLPPARRRRLSHVPDAPSVRTCDPGLQVAPSRLACPAGFEPATHGLEGRCSVRAELRAGRREFKPEEREIYAGSVPTTWASLRRSLYDVGVFVGFPGSGVFVGFEVCGWYPRLSRRAGQRRGVSVGRSGVGVSVRNRRRRVVIMSAGARDIIVRGDHTTRVSTSPRTTTAPIHGHSVGNVCTPRVDGRRSIRL